MSSRLSGPFVATVVSATFLAGTALTTAAPAIVAADDGPSCPPGQRLVDRAELAGEYLLPTVSADSPTRDPDLMLDPMCVPLRLPEAPGEIMAASLARQSSFTAPYTDAPDGLLQAAVDQAEALAAPAAQARVANTDGTWAPYGNGLLIGDDDRYTETAAQGLTNLAGRIDSLTYDADNDRVFAVGGTSGVWMSENKGESWVSIGDNLPSVANGAGAWTPAGGGTLVVASGEPTFGGASYLGMGAWWTNDLGATWHKADGVPDNHLGFAVEVDQSNPDVVYVANGFGLFRSTDAGRTFVNVELPTSPDCAGVTGQGNPCDTANVVTDVIVKAPGGTTNEAGGEVLAVVGHRNENRTYPDGTVRSPGQGLYRSDTGEPGTFVRLEPLSSEGLTNLGWPADERVGRVEFGQAWGPDQNHNFVYAMISDPVLMAGGTPGIDIPESIDQEIPDPRDIASDVECQISGLCIGVAPNTALNGIYVSDDFGDTWFRAADDTEIADNPTTGSTLAPLRALIAPGIQAWYNQWIEPDPTRADPVTGAPTRVLFGLEEIWSHRTQTGVPVNGVAQSGENDWWVVGRYFGGERCAFLDNPVPIPACPLANPPTTTYTTHPDQHDALWIPLDDGGVRLLVGNDGGVYRSDLAAGEDIDNTKWTPSNDGMNTLLPYSVAVSEDGTVYFGLQDNGTAKIDPNDDLQIFMPYVGDGTGATVDPYDSNIAWASTPGGAFVYTTNGGQSYNYADAGLSDDSFQFVTPWAMDPTDEMHQLTAGNHVWSNVSGPADAWVDVFSLGSPEEQPEIANLGTSMAARGDAEYVAYCGVCDVYRNSGFRFLSGIATNVAGDEAPFAGEPDGWHHAAAAGLPERWVTSLWIDESDAETVYATLGGYARDWAGIDTYTDPDRGVNSQGGSVHKSTDAGETFVDISSNLPNVRANSVIQRGSQLIVGTDVGVFISSDLDGTEWAKLDGAPTTIVTQVALRPDHPDELFAALYGRSIWRYTFGSTDVADDTAAAEPAPEPEAPAPAPLPATGGGLALIGLAGLASAAGLRRRRR